MSTLEFNQMLLSNTEFLKPFAFTLTRDNEAAKDLLQETMYRALANQDKYNVGTNIKAWLYQIMKNSYINNYRKKVKEPSKVEFDENHFCFKTVHDGLFDLAYLQRRHYKEMFEDEIAHSIESLPNTLKPVIILRDIEELTYSEIARVVACPVGTVRSRLHRGRKILQKRLLNYAKDNGYLIKSGRNARCSRSHDLASIVGLPSTMQRD